MDGPYICFLLLHFWLEFKDKSNIILEFVVEENDYHAANPLSELCVLMWCSNKDVHILATALLILVTGFFLMPIT